MPHGKKIEEIKSKTHCSKDFECLSADGPQHCKVKNIGAEALYECLSEKPKECEYALAFGYSWFCQCPLQLYLAGLPTQNQIANPK